MSYRLIIDVRIQVAWQLFLRNLEERRVGEKPSATSIDGHPRRLAFRPVEETVVDTLAWDRTVDGDRPTLAHDKEREILAAR